MLTADHSEDTLEHCRLLLLLVHKFPKTISTYGVSSSIKWNIMQWRIIFLFNNQNLKIDIIYITLYYLAYLLFIIWSLITAFPKIIKSLMIL